MRLSDKQISSIKEAVADNIAGYRLMLFGSRVNDKELGGDIDLLILTNEKMSRKVIRNIRREIWNRIGEQKIDIVNYTKDEENNFKNMILKEAVEL